MHWKHWRDKVMGERRKGSQVKERERERDGHEPQLKVSEALNIRTKAASRYTSAEGT